MKPKALPAAHGRHSAPAFVLLHGLEVVQLRRVSWMARALFMELLALSDHATGRVQSSYAQLAALLAFDVAPQSRESGRASVQQVRTALQALVAVRLVRIDPGLNEARQALILRVDGRSSKGASAEMLNRVSNTERRAKSSGKSRGCVAAVGDVQRTEQQVCQEGLFPPNPPVVHRAADAVARDVEHLRAVRRTLPRGKA